MNERIVVLVRGRHDSSTLSTWGLTTPVTLERINNPDVSTAMTLKLWEPLAWWPYESAPRNALPWMEEEYRGGRGRRDFSVRAQSEVPPDKKGSFTHIEDYVRDVERTNPGEIARLAWKATQDLCRGTK